TEPAGLFFAEAGTYAQFHEALRSRAEALNVSRTELNLESGLQDGYLAKLLSPTPMKGAITRTALEPVLRSLGLRLIIVADPNTAAARGELPQRQASAVRLNNSARKSAGRRKPRAKSARIKKPAKVRRCKPYLAR